MPSFDKKEVPYHGSNNFTQSHTLIEGSLPLLRPAIEAEVRSRVRDVEICYRLDPKKPLLADLRGLVTRVNKRGGIIFIILRDATGAIQIVGDHSVLTKESWDILCSIRVMDRLHVHGRVGETRQRRLSIYVENLRKFLEGTDCRQIQIADPEQRGLTTKLLLASVRSRAVAYFQSQGYLEFEPAYFSPIRGDQSIEPLRVVFPGEGAPVYLVPSPALQALEVILVAPCPQVFCVSRCFSNIIRDGYTSAESMILCAVKLGASMQEMTTLAQQVVKATLSHFTTMPKTLRAWLDQESWPSRECSWASNSITVNLLSPEINVFSVPPQGRQRGLHNTSNLLSVFRICWPPHSVVAEGHVESIDSKIALGGVTIHLERMVRILSEVNLRYLRHYT